MKVTISAAMRARDVSRPQPEHFAESEGAGASALKGAWANEVAAGQAETGEAGAGEAGTGGTGGATAECRAIKPRRSKASGPAIRRSK